jgi:hypothetical protein
MPVEYNKGNIAEAVLASGIGARFKKRFQQSDFKGVGQNINIGNLPLVSVDDLKSVLRELVKGQVVSYTVYDLDRKQKKTSDITDNINVSVAIPTKDLQFLQTESNWSKIGPIFSAALSKINGDNKLKAQAYGLSVNKKYDTINVSAQGTLDQKGTKVDISVSISSRDPSKRIGSALRGSQISLKYDAPQFAQAVGLEFENFGKIFDELGLNDYRKFSEMFEKEVMLVYPDILGKRFEDREQIKNSNEVKALKKVAKLVFQKVNEQLNRKLSDPAFKNILARYCINKATLNESGVELVKFTSKGKASTQSFGSNFVENVVASDLESSFIGTGSDPKIIVHLAGKGATKANMLIQFRYRTDASSKDRFGKQKILMRSYVESGDLLYKL